MGFFKKRGKQTVAQAFSPQASPARLPIHGKARNTNACTSDSGTIVTVSTKRRILVNPLVPNFETNHSNNTNEAVVAVYDPDSEEPKSPPQSFPSFGSSNLDEKGNDSKLGLRFQGVGRSVQPMSKDAPHQTREPVFMTHGQDLPSSTMVRDQGSARDDPPAHTVESANKKRSDKKHVSKANKNIYTSGSNSQKYDEISHGSRQNNARKYYDIEVGGKKVSASTDLSPVVIASASKASLGWFAPRSGLPLLRDKNDSREDESLKEYSISDESHSTAHSNIQQSDHRDDEPINLRDWNANYSSSHVDGCSVEYSTRDSMVDFVKNSFDQVDMSIHGTTSYCSCPLFESNDGDGDDFAEKMMVYTEHETITTKSVFEDGDEESSNNDFSIGEESFDNSGSSDGGISVSCSVSLDDRTFLSDGDGSMNTKKVEPSGWETWFGCGQGGDKDKEENEDTSMTSSDEGTYLTSSDDGTAFSEKPEEAMKDEKRLADGVDTIIANKVINGRSSALDPSKEQKYDSEGLLLPSSKPLRRVPSLVKSLMKVKGNGHSAEEKSVATESSRLLSMTPSDKTICSKKSMPKASMNSKVEVCDKLYVDKSLWDADERQRDLFCANHGGLETLTVRQYSNVPVPYAPDHVLVKVEASTVSARDCIVRAGGHLNTSSTPFVPGFQVVGRVCVLGDEVDPFKIRVGNRIAALLPSGGGNAKYVSVHFSLAIILSESANHDDIICLVANYMTAYQCLKLAKKDGVPLTNANVLITRASGPVGQALIELALQEGANVYATAHKMHEEHLTKLGTKWFSVNPEKWLPALESKMDVVVDLTIDGYESSYRALTDDGILICNVGDESKLQYLSKSDDNPGTTIWWSTLKAKLSWGRAIFYDLEESYRTNPRLFAHELHYLTCKLQRGEIRPKVAGRVTLNQVPKAQQLIEKGLPNGTVVCLPWKKLDPNQKVKVEKCG
ncbi:hypothetical protein ACHAXA_005499 [Cyclostephanos tholiformis]|uniref:Enoyl reductase (ER) domain-containing protein n=1 Tax=Cyclostephanos tholiformis TaxID=382380 RepID=A0ABD3R7C0_9STRA